MTLSNNLGSYTDVQSVFDAVLEHGPATLNFPTSGKASYWRMRAYHFRKLLHNRQARQGEVEINFTSTPYDSIVIRFNPESRAQLRVEEVALSAEVTFDSGADMPREEPGAAKPVQELTPDDPTAQAAKEFMAALKGEKK
jgi:hypothetical protein